MLEKSKIKSSGRNVYTGFFLFCNILPFESVGGGELCIEVKSSAFSHATVFVVHMT